MYWTDSSYGQCTALKYLCLGRMCLARELLVLWYKCHGQKKVVNSSDWYFVCASAVEVQFRELRDVENAGELHPREWYELECHPFYHIFPLLVAQQRNQDIIRDKGMSLQLDFILLPSPTIIRLPQGEACIFAFG